MADVFISYSKVDHAIAESLAGDLTASGFDVWWDFQLYAGDDFHDMIRAEIAIAKAVIVIWSDAAAASRWVRGEAQEADDHGTLISTSVPDFNTRGVPINFRSLHCEPVDNRDRIIDALKHKGASQSSLTEEIVPPSEDAKSDWWDEVREGWGSAKALLEAAILAIDDRRTSKKYEDMTRHDYQALAERLHADYCISGRALGAVEVMQSIFNEYRPQRYELSYKTWTRFEHELNTLKSELE